MDKQRYLETTFHQLNTISTDTNFKNQLYQVRARAIHDELGQQASPSIGFTFETAQIWRYCDFVLNETTLLLLEDYGNRDELLARLKEIAEAFEFLSKFAGKDNEEILLINSAICYHLAGFQANALCLSRLVEDKFLKGNPIPDDTDNVDELFAFLYRQCLIDFFKRDIVSLRQRTTSAIRRIQTLQETVTRRVSEGTGSINDLMDITAHAFFHHALSSFVEFCINGTDEAIALLEQNSRKSSTYFRKTGDIRLGTITAALVPLVQVFHDSSTWHVIAKSSPAHRQNPVWQAYLRNLALAKSIVEFWPAQLIAIENGLLSNDDSYVVQMPTSAGKTFVAELAILAALTAQENAQCLYIAPYRALVNEVKSKLSDTLGAVGYRVSTLIGGFEFDSFQEFLLTNSDVLVATPEKTELLLRTYPEFFEALTLIVIDEGHMIDEGIPDETSDENPLTKSLEDNGTLGRGPLLEVLTTRIKTTYPNVRFIFLSAVMPAVNAQDFVNWLAKTKKDPLKINTSLRPSRQVLAKFEWFAKHDGIGNGELEYISLDPLPDGKYPFVPYFITRKKYLTGELTPGRGQAQKKTWPTDFENKTQTTAVLAATFARSGPTLVFCAQRGDTIDVIKNIVLTLKYFEASNQIPHPVLKYQANPDMESYSLSLDWLGATHPLTQALQYGVGLHIGPLPDPVRQAIEDDYKAGNLRILVSTNTLGQGVNLPIKTAIIYSLERAWIEKDENGDFIGRKTESIKRRDFWNICGRAGRAGKETEGQVIFVKISENDANLFSQYQSEIGFEEVDSALYKLLLALIENRITQDELLGYLDSHVLALIAEEVVNTEVETEIEAFLNQSLVGVQAQRKNTIITPLVSAIKNTSGWIKSRVPEKDRIQTFAATGLRLTSCESLERAVDQFLSNAETQNILLHKDSDILECNPILIRYAFDACSNLPEMKLDKQIEYTPQQPQALFDAWIRGVPISEIRTQFWNQNHIEDFGRYVSDQLTYKLPWGINGFLHILASKLQQEFHDLPRAWQHLPAMVKFGVQTVIACWAGSIGISSRAFAKEISDVYLERHGVIDFQEFAVWTTNLPNEFILREMRGTKFEKQRFFEARNQLFINRDILNHFRNQNIAIVAEVRGIQYEGRQEIALLVNQGDQLHLEIETDNLYDPYAVKVFFRDQQIGYVERDKARIISRELQIGRSYKAFVVDVDHNQRPSYNYSIIRFAVQIEM